MNMVLRFPASVVSIVVVLFCFYIHAKKKRETYDVTTPTAEGDNTIPQHLTVSVEVDEENRCYDIRPPRYSSVDSPPPYTLVSGVTLATPRTLQLQERKPLVLVFRLTILTTIYKIQTHLLYTLYCYLQVETVYNILKCT